MTASPPTTRARVRNLRRLLLAIATALLVPASAHATVIDLSGPAGSIHIDGQTEGDAAGAQVADAGDVNGDGKRDFIVTAPFAGNNGRVQSGSVYVIYGGQNLASVDLNNLGSAGFRIDGAAAQDRAGSSVGGGADINGDGLADVIIGAPNASTNGRVDSGSVYVVYGRRSVDPPDVDLAKITTTQASRGLRIDGAQARDMAGYSVALADVNGDGLADAIVGAMGASNNGRDSSGSVYVIYGQDALDLGDLDLATITDTAAASPTRGFRIDGGVTGDEAGWSVAGARDVNGDGIGDVILGANGAGNQMRTLSGSAYVIYGQRGTAATHLDLSTITLGGNARGFRIDGAAPNDEAGTSVAGIGDVNGDGVDDVMVGAPWATRNGRAHSGSAYIVYGQRTADPADVDLGKLAATQPVRGVEFDGAAANDAAGFSIAGGGDVNGNGHSDILIGAPEANSRGKLSGSVYIIDGQASTGSSPLDLGTIARAPASVGVELDGTSAPSLLGTVAVADVTGDSRPEALIGGAATGTTAGFSGAAYVVDLAPPDTVIDAGPTVTRDPTPTFSFHATEPGSFRCSVDTGVPAFTTCSGPDASHTTARLADGTYTFRVAAVDRFGNTDPTPATQSFRIDTTAPNTSITRHPKKTLTLARRRHTTAVTFAFAASEPNATFMCRLDAGPYRHCTSPVVLRLARGPHTFSVIAADALGNQDRSAASFSVTVRSAKPTRRSRRHR